jgi:hypothetical protein
VAWLVAGGREGWAMSALLDRAAETAAVEGVLGAVLAILLRRHGL